jgi:cell wall assembly regulator SMI1
MSWRNLISASYETRAEQPGIAGKPQFYPAALAGDIADAEARLNATLPASIRSLLLETNGVMDLMAIDGGDWFDSMWLLWTVDDIVKRNVSWRAATAAGTYKRDFHQMVFFADAGTDGILFGFPVMEDYVCAPRVVVWHPIMDELGELAPSLEDFLQGWLTGTISV